MFALLSTDAAVGVGANETIEYQPPSGSTLDGGTVDVTLSATGGGPNASGTAIVYTPDYAYDGSDVVYQCAWGLGGCGASGSDAYTGTIALPNGRGGNLYVSAGCGGAGGYLCDSGGANGSWAEAQLWWADLLLANDSSPTASGFGGSLLSPNVSGTGQLAFTATDANGPGVYKVTVLIDGTAVYSATPSTDGGSCAPVGTDPSSGALMFDDAQPCPQSESVDLPIPTTALSDGPHDLKVIVTDAAQNSSTVLDQTITTANRTTVSSLLNTPPTAPGSSSRSPAAATVYAFALAAATRRLGASIKRGFDTSAVRLAGTLESEAGVPAAGVPVALWAQPLSGGAWQQLANTSTSGTGAWTLNAPRGSSRLLRIVPGAGGQPTSAPSTVSLSETVAPSLSLRVTSTGAARIVFTGHLAIAPLGSPRPIVFIEVEGPDGWQAVGAPVRVGPRGNYRYVYRSSPFTIGRRFVFRAVTPATALWPAATSPTPTSEVH